MKKKYLISFASPDLKRSADRYYKQAKSLDFYDEIFVFSVSDLEKESQDKILKLLKENKKNGYGYWFWKPLILKQLLKKIRERDIIHYTDVGCHLNPSGLKRLNYYIEKLQNTEKGLLAFQYNPLKDYNYEDFEFPNIAEYICTKAELFDYFDEKKYLNSKRVRKVKNIFPSNISKYQMFRRDLHKFSKTLKNKNILATRADFKEFGTLKTVSNLITSGVTSWKKINKKGILVNSSLDGFGENYREIENVYKGNQNCTYKLTYKENNLKSKFPIISHYSLTPLINDTTIDNLFIAESFYWMSFSAFKMAIQLRPEIMNKRNACGPGQTYIQISKFIPKNQLNIYLTYEDFKKFELK